MARRCSTGATRSSVSSCSTTSPMAPRMPSPATRSTRFLAQRPIADSAVRLSRLGSRLRGQHQSIYRAESSMRRAFIRTLVPIAVIAMVAGACSGDDDDASTPVDSAAAPADSADTADSAGAPDSVATDDSAATDDTDASAGSTTPDAAEEVQAGESVLDRVKSAGTVKCGVRDDLAGFSTLDAASGDHVGFDADFCRVDRGRRARRFDQGHVRGRGDREPLHRPCSPVRSTSSCATRRGRLVATARTAPTSCTRRSTTASR